MSDSKSGPPDRPVPAEIVEAVLRVARAQGIAVAEVPLRDIATEAGISRSTLIRRLGGTRQALDQALIAAGVDLGAQKPVRERAIEAAASLISELGLPAVTLERVAQSAQCSVHSLYAVFGGRDDLLHAVYNRYSPILDVEAVLADTGDDLETAVRRIYRLLAEVIDREPRVLPAMLAELLARPSDEGVQTVFEYAAPRMFDSIGRWLTAQIAAGRIRDIPPILLVQQMTSPIVWHFLLRPAVSRLTDAGLPTADEAIETFAQNFLRAIALPGRP